MIVLSFSRKQAESHIIKSSVDQCSRRSVLLTLNFISYSDATF